MALRVNSFTLSTALPKIESRAGNYRSPSLSVNSQMMIQMRKEGGGRRIWKRRTLIKKDRTLNEEMERMRVPFLEEQVRKIRNEGKLVLGDIDALLLSEDNKYAFVNEISAEANACVERNRDEYGGGKKANFQALSDRMNDAGIYRPDAYFEPDPFKPGRHFRKEFFT